MYAYTPSSFILSHPSASKHAHERKNDPHQGGANHTRDRLYLVKQLVACHKKRKGKSTRARRGPEGRKSERGEGGRGTGQVQINPSKAIDCPYEREVYCCTHKVSRVHPPLEHS